MDNDVIFLCMVFVKKQKKSLKMMTDEKPCMTSDLDVPGNGLGFYHWDREKAEDLVRKRSKREGLKEADSAACGKEDVKLGQQLHLGLVTGE